MLIPRPLDVDAFIRKVRRGRVVTMGELRKRLARDAGADTACPLCTGIFVRIAAGALEGGSQRRIDVSKASGWN